MCAHFGCWIQRKTLKSLSCIGCGLADSSSARKWRADRYSGWEKIVLLDWPGDLLVKSWRPRFPSVISPSLPKIEVGTYTLSPVVGIVYLRHSRFGAPACNVVDTRPSKTTRANVRRKCRGKAGWALTNRDGRFIAKAPRRERERRLFLRFPNCAQRPVKDRGRDRQSMDRDR